MTQAIPTLFRSKGSDRAVIPGWNNILPSTQDALELQLDIAEADMNRSQALLLIEYWATNADMTLQSLLPVRAFQSEPKGWCAFLPAQGRVFIRAIDPQPNPPLLSAHGINLDPQTPVGTLVHIKVEFPRAPLLNEN
ncbi:uracil-DNA glycosylase [Deinococcus sp. KNUC1210]|uniref:uracil-DNA glycosylase n=1 Tax=Deinococcus sp. KNUC1210 TaxID=2917691 RepID=UPI001EEFFACA|nr:uracil-DNA glycosylase [Deinococcus sp. KNUC1210]ULH15584.1 uracil-DNA glycosylase [Deinococcus sp. KNUC1210]